jgi:DNA-binding LacI/PurR family transcriptional regulator
MKSPTIKDVALKAGVSTATVSRYLRASLKTHRKACKISTNMV